jgi:hypothetical protein
MFLKEQVGKPKRGEGLFRWVGEVTASRQNTGRVRINDTDPIDSPLIRPH